VFHGRFTAETKEGGEGLVARGRIIDTSAPYPLISQDFFGLRGRGPRP
jgi:hypothetical protein